MIRFRLLRIAFVTMLLLMVSVSTMAQSSEVPGQMSEVPESTVEEAFRIQAEMYAESVGVSVEEAMRRLELQHEVGLLRAELMTHEQDVMSEVRIMHEPDFHVIVYVVSGGESQVSSYFASGPLSEITTIEIVPYTHDQLRKDLDTAESLIDPLGILYAASISEKDVSIYVVNVDDLQQELNSQGTPLPESVQLVEMQEEPQNAGTVIGGFGTSDGCTSGFAGWFSSSSTGKGVLGSGHCGGVGGTDIQFDHIPGANFTWQNDFVGGSSDFGFNRHNASHTLRSMINIGTTWIPITGLYWRVSMTQGAYVCKFGRTTQHNCGFIHSNSYRPMNEPGLQGGTITYSATFIWVKNKAVPENTNGPELTGTTLVISGDSGGPWHGGLSATQNSAFGITKGWWGKDGYFMAQDHLYSRGYRIFTNCPTVGGITFKC